MDPSRIVKPLGSGTPVDDGEGATHVDGVVGTDLQRLHGRVELGPEGLDGLTRRGVDGEEVRLVDAGLVRVAAGATQGEKALLSGAIWAKPPPM